MIVLGIIFILIVMLKLLLFPSFALPYSKLVGCFSFFFFLLLLEIVFNLLLFFYNIDKASNKGGIIEERQNLLLTCFSNFQKRSYRKERGIAPNIASTHTIKLRMTLMAVFILSKFFFFCLHTLKKKKN